MTGGVRKGADLLADALAKLPRDTETPKAVLFGDTASELLGGANVEVIRLGSINDEARLAMLYAACDVFACPSREDNLPNTVLESLCAGTPVVGFRIGGLPDMVENEVNGFLAAPFDTAELAAGLSRVMTSQRADGRLGHSARRIAEERFSSSHVAAEYLEIYRRRGGTVTHSASTLK